MRPVDRPCPVIAPAASALALVLAVAGPGGCVKPPPAETPGVGAAASVDSTLAEPLWTPPSVGALYQAGEVRGFELRQAGRVFAHSYGRYVGPDPNAPEHHVFETRIQIDLPSGQTLRSQGRLVLDGRGQLVSGFERSDAAQIRFQREGDTLELQSGGTKDTVTYAPDTVDTAVMAHSAILHEELMLGLRELSEGEVEWRLLSVSGGVPVQWEATVDPPTEDGGVITLRTNLGEDIRFRDGRIERILVPADRLDIRAMDPAPAWPTWELAGPRTLTYRPPAGALFEIRPVELPGQPGQAVLKGDVLVPRDLAEDEGSQTRPGVLFLSAGGQQDRYGFSGPPPVDLGSHEITDALVSAGFVVLRYDEAGFGDSETAELSFATQVEDARRGIRTLMVQEEVDPDRLLVVAHGEGGWRGLLLAVDRPREIAGVALLATPGRPYREVMQRQAEANLSRVPPDLREQARAEQDKMLDALQNGGQVPPELMAQARWIREIMAVDPAGLVAKVDCPLWLAQGGKDFEVDPKADLDALVRAAKKARTRHTVARYPDLDHLFVLEEGVSEPSHYLQEGRRVDEAFLADLVAWAKTVTRGRRRGR